MAGCPSRGPHPQCRPVPGPGIESGSFVLWDDAPPWPPHPEAQTPVCGAALGETTQGSSKESPSYGGGGAGEKRAELQDPLSSRWPWDGAPEREVGGGPPAEGTGPQARPARGRRGPHGTAQKRRARSNHAGPSECKNS